MAIRSQIAAIAANQIGRLQGELEARLLVEASKLFSKFANECPNTEELIKIANTRNNLLKTINQFQRLTNRFSTLTDNITPPISVARTVINLLKTNPIPVAIGTPPGPAGGLIFSKTSGQLTSLSDRLLKVTQLLEALEDDVNAINSLVAGVTPSLNNTKNLLESINSRIQDCAEEKLANAKDSSDPNTVSNLAEIKNLLDSVQPLENTGSEGTPSEEYLYRGANGKDYTLAIIQEKQGEGPVPRRIAVAKDNLGVIILRGQPSFSSDTKVLLDELKFRIDNQLP